MYANEVVKEIRKRIRSMPLRQAVRETGLSAATVSAFRNDKRPLSQSSLEVLAMAVGMDSGELEAGDSNGQKKSRARQAPSAPPAPLEKGDLVLGAQFPLVIRCDQGTVRITAEGIQFRPRKGKHWHKPIGWANAMRMAEMLSFTD